MLRVVCSSATDAFRFALSREIQLCEIVSKRQRSSEEITRPTIRSFFLPSCVFLSFACLSSLDISSSCSIPLSGTFSRHDPARCALTGSRTSLTQHQKVIKHLLSETFSDMCASPSFLPNFRLRAMVSIVYPGTVCTSCLSSVQIRTSMLSNKSRCIVFHSMRCCSLGCFFNNQLMIQQLLTVELCRPTKRFHTSIRQQLLPSCLEEPDSCWRAFRRSNQSVSLSSTGRSEFRAVGGKDRGWDGMQAPAGNGPDGVINLNSAVYVPILWFWQQNLGYQGCCKLTAVRTSTRQLVGTCTAVEWLPKHQRTSINWSMNLGTVSSIERAAMLYGRKCWMFIFQRLKWEWNHGCCI
jgi:hypothetical protein